MPEVISKTIKKKVNHKPNQKTQSSKKSQQICFNKGTDLDFIEFDQFQTMNHNGDQPLVTTIVSMQEQEPFCRCIQENEPPISDNSGIDKKKSNNIAIKQSVKQSVKQSIKQSIKQQQKEQDKQVKQKDIDDEINIILNSEQLGVVLHKQIKQVGKISEPKKKKKKQKQKIQKVRLNQKSDIDFGIIQQKEQQITICHKQSQINSQINTENKQHIRTHQDQRTSHQKNNAQYQQRAQQKIVDKKYQQNLNSEQIGIDSQQIGANLQINQSSMNKNHQLDEMNNKVTINIPNIANISIKQNKLIQQSNDKQKNIKQMLIMNKIEGNQRQEYQQKQRQGFQQKQRQEYQQKQRYVIESRDDLQIRQQNANEIETLEIVIDKVEINKKGLRKNKKKGKKSEKVVVNVTKIAEQPIFQEIISEKLTNTDNIQLKSVQNKSQNEQFNQSISQNQQQQNNQISQVNQISTITEDKPNTTDQVHQPPNLIKTSSSLSEIASKYLGSRQLWNKCESIHQVYLPKMKQLRQQINLVRQKLQKYQNLQIIQNVQLSNYQNIILQYLNNKSGIQIY